MLKNVFNYVLRVGSTRGLNIRQNSLQSRQLCSVGTDIIKHQPFQDELLNEVRQAKNTLEVLDILGGHNDLSTHQTIACLQAVFNLQKPNKCIINSSKIIRHRVFANLCRNLQRHARKLNLNETIDSLKILNFLGMQPNSQIMTSLLSLIRHQVNDITLAHLVFLDSLLKKMEKTPLVEALMIALPMIFQIQLPFKMDRENIRELNDCLVFAIRHHVSDQAKMSIVTALTLHGEGLPALQAAFTLRHMCDLKPYNEGYDKLILNCFAILNKNFHDLHFNTLESILQKVVYGYSVTAEIFYNEEFMENCAKFAIKTATKAHRVFGLLKEFKKISFVNIELLDYHVRLLAEDPQMLETVTQGHIFTLVGALSNANYVPPEWKIIKEHVLRNPLFESKRVDLPWLKFVLDLLVLDIWIPKLIEWIFDPDFLRQHFARENNDSSYYRLLTLYQVVNTLKKEEYMGPLPGDKYLIKAEELRSITSDDQPLGPSLKYIYSNFSILSKARTRLGHTIDHVIVLDHDNHPAEPSSSSESTVDELTHSQTVEDLQEKGFKLLAIIKPPKSWYINNFDRLKGVFVLQLKTLEEILPVVLVSEKTWKSLHEKEKMPYLDQVIREKLESCQ